MTPATRFLTRPLYLQVRDTLVERITAGIWKPGSAIPNEIELSRELSVSSGTVRKALEVMENENIVERRQGRGTFVRDHEADQTASFRFNNICDAEGNRVGTEFRDSTSEVTNPNEAEHARLDLRPRGDVIRVRRLRLHRNQPYMWETTALPASLYPILPASVGDYRISVLAQQNGILLGRAEEAIAVTVAANDVAESLEVAPRTPLLKLDRIIFALDGRPAEWRVGLCALGEKNYLARLG